MTFEHFALNVAHLQDMVDWYQEHIGLKVVKQLNRPPFMTFLADSADRIVLELYHRPEHKMTDFKKEHHITFHIAFISVNAQQDKERLQKVGCSFIEEAKKDDGTHLVMLRDPWGLPLQLCQRATPF
ncbi:VOC family protein [Flavobacterium sp. ASW18X]|uniref:VOC family protein n=1 Tax=Flavobacterium sp. ASW18X TaxID=2572595 RepID=UPI0010AE4E99|nr:VOC family protein [Flavobacterium sp. ASW18X]TKD66495.1 VOC family protein [Flavobacterium sp. ASW18X]